MHELTFKHRSTGHGGALIDELDKLSRSKLIKAANVSPTRATTITTLEVPARPRMGLFAPLFDQTRSANLAKAASTLPAPHGPREDFKAPSPPSAPDSMTTPTAYRRAAPLPDPEEVRHHAHMRDTAAARQAVLDSIKRVHAAGPGALR